MGCSAEGEKEKDDAFLTSMRTASAGKPEKKPQVRDACRKKESADKPGSVVDNHSSGSCVATCLKRPTREPCGPHLTFPYLVLLRVGFTLPPRVTTGAVRSYRTISTLPDPRRAIGGMFSVALAVGLRLPGVTWHPALWSPDFPPCLGFRQRDCLADSAMDHSMFRAGSAARTGRYGHFP